MRLAYHAIVVGAGCTIAGASGCASAAPAGPPRIITVGRPTDPYRVFPVARARAATALECAPVGPPDSTVAYQRAETNSRYLGALSLRLPPEYTLIPRAERPGRAEVVGGLIVASWYAPGGDQGRRPSGVSAWVVPESGFPTIGADPRTHQVTFSECETSGQPVRGARVAVFTLATAADTTAYLAAVWPVGNGRRLQILASAPHTVQLEPIRRALLDAVTEPPR